jgi:hypothetical protein
LTINKIGGDILKRGLIFFVLVICLLLGQIVYAGEKDKEWDVIKKISHKNTTYSLVQNRETDDLFFMKEEREKGKRKEVFRTLVGTYKNKVHAGIHLKQQEIVLFFIDQENLSFVKVDDSSGEVKKNVKLPRKTKPEKKKKNTKQRSLKRQSASTQQQTLDAEEPLQAPVFFTVEKATPTSVNLKWDEVEGADHYRVYETMPFEDEEARKLVAETESTALTLDHLEPRELYAYYLRAVRDGVESEEVMVAVWTPEHMEYVEAQSTTDSISIGWSPVDGAKRYELELFGWEGKLQEEEVEEEKSFTFTDLEPKSPYVVQLQAVGETYALDSVVLVSMTHPSEDSEDEEVPDFPDPPAPTGNLDAPSSFTVEPEQTKAHLSWESVRGADGYVLWINGERKIELGDVNTYELTDLTPYTPYELHLRAVDEKGRDGQSSVQSFFTLPDRLDPPVVKVEKVTSVSAYLTWAPVKAARSYTITYNGRSETFPKRNVKVTGLKEKQHYVFTITAEHKSVKSAPVQVEIETIPFTYDYVYDGSLLDSITSSYEQKWEYLYDKNGNIVKMTFSPEPKREKQEFHMGQGVTEVRNEETVVENR